MNVWPSGFQIIRKNQMKSTNHDICHGVMLSYMEVVLKNWEGFTYFVTYNVNKLKQLRRRS
jgi:hypothetical protein